MKDLNRASLASTLGLAMIVWAPHVARAEQAAGAEAGWAAITKCAALADDEARHTCSDEVLRKAGLLPTAQAKASEQRKKFGLERPAVRETSAPVTSGAASVKSEDDLLHVTLTHVAKGGDGKLALTTSEGAVWRQIESATLYPMPVEGQAMAIEKTRLGGFMCKPSPHVTFRCLRAR